MVHFRFSMESAGYLSLQLRYVRLLVITSPPWSAGWARRIELTQSWDSWIAMIYRRICPWGISYVASSHFVASAGNHRNHLVTGLHLPATPHTPKETICPKVTRIRMTQYFPRFYCCLLLVAGCRLLAVDVVVAEVEVFCTAGNGSQQTSTRNVPAHFQQQEVNTSTRTQNNACVEKKVLQQPPSGRLLSWWTLPPFQYLEVVSFTCSDLNRTSTVIEPLFHLADQHSAGKWWKRVLATDTPKKEEWQGQVSHNQRQQPTHFSAWPLDGQKIWAFQQCAAAAPAATTTCENKPLDL